MNCQHLDHNAVCAMLPDRDPQAHKGNFGKILLLCGSLGYTGAAALAAMGALRSGAGLVYLGVPESIYPIMATKLTEPVVFPLSDENGRMSYEAISEIIPRLPQTDAVLIGPGMGQSDANLAVLREILNTYPGTVVVDADGINLL